MKRSRGNGEVLAGGETTAEVVCGSGGGVGVKVKGEMVASGPSMWKGDRGGNSTGLRVHEGKNATPRPGHISSRGFGEKEEQSVIKWGHT